MTKQERAIIMAHTGICMLTGEDFNIFYEYVEKLMGRPIFTHELGNKEISETIKEKSLNDFLKLCREERVSDDCVSRKEVLNLVRFNAFHVKSQIKAIENMPPVTPTHKVGKWIGAKHPICPKCNCNIIEEYISYTDYARMYKPMKFCPNCGADMRGKEDGSN